MLLKLGFFVSALRKPIDLALKELEGLGLASVDLPGELSLDWKAIGEAVKSYDFKVGELSGQFDRFELTHPDESVRDASIAYGEKAIDLAASLETGCEVSFFTDAETLKTHGASSLIAKGKESLTRLNKSAVDKGVPLFIETINRFELLPHVCLLTKVSEALEMITDAQLSNVGIVCDTWNFNLEEKSLSDGLRSCGQRLQHVHLADSNRGLPGSGSIDYKEFLRQVRAMGYRGYMTLEPKHPPTRQEIADSISYLNALEPFI
jgi:D-psicose/D-tagatose/L-ribulose 3-epimerase